MFLIIQELTKSQEPSQTHTKTHFWTYESIETKENTKALIETPRNTIKIIRTAN